MEEQKQQFVNGDVDAVRLGGYGGTVHLEVTDAGIRVRTTQPKRRQTTIGSDTREVRGAAVKVADKILEEARNHRVPTVKPRAVQKNDDGVYMLTPQDIWEGYLEELLGQLPEGILTWGKNELLAFYKATTPAARNAMPSFDYINNVLVSARRLHNDDILAFEKDLSTVQPGDLSKYLTTQVRLGYSPGTMKTYFSRFRTAVRSFRRQWPDRWQNRKDPTDDVRKPSTKGMEPDEVREERARLIIRQLRENGEWRTAAVALVALESGRRVGAIGARRPGQQLDTVPLCAEDFDTASDGRLEVTWRGNAAKGMGYGEGDVVQPCTRALAAVYRWLRLYHPNPLGPEHPLIWDENDPRYGPNYDQLRTAFKQAWEQATGEEKPRGLLWHSFVYTVVTTIADESTIQAAAEYTGRTPETAMRSYKRRRRSRAARTADLLDELRS